MLFRKQIRTIGQYKAQFISMILMIMLGVGIFVGFQGEWFSLQENTGRFYEESGFADYRLIESQGFSEKERDAIAAIPEVDAVSRLLSVTAEVESRKGDTLALLVTENPSVAAPYLIEGAPYDAEDKTGVWLSDRYAALNDFAVGDPIVLSYQSLRLEGVVRGLCKSSEELICVRDETQLMPDLSSHGFAYLSPAFCQAALGQVFYPQLNVISSLSKKDFTEAADKALGKSVVILSKEENISYSGTQSEIEEGKTMGSVLPVLFLLIAVLTMVTTMHRIAAREKTQIGTLKALGFRDRRILFHYTSFALTTGLVGSALGVALGLGITAYFTLDSGPMGTYFDMPFWAVAIPPVVFAILVLLIAALTLIGFLSVKKMLRGTAADALHPYTPRRVRTLAIEKTRAFHRLSFAARWNLRDVFRHLSRTAMSLLGVVGCTIILVGGLGMRDTMDSFLSRTFQETMRYSSRIYLADSLEKADREALAAQYDGDWSCSQSVQLDDEAAALEIYQIDHDLVRFTDENEQPLALSDSGVTLCLRTARAHSLSPGDDFTVTPYGTDQSITLHVASIQRSTSESIVMTRAYAESVGLSAQPESIYTQTEKDSIPLSDRIKSVQSRQMILDSFDVFLELMNLMVALLIFAGALLAAIVLYSLGNMSYAERTRELATLKVVGFRDRRIARLLIQQNLWITLLGALLGLPLGMLTLDSLIQSLASEYELRMAVGAPTLLISALLTFAVSLLVSLIVARKNRRIDMVEALKFAE